MDQYNLPVGVNIEQLAANLRAGIDLLSQTNQAAQTTTQTIREGFNQASEAVNTTNRNVTQSVGAYNASRNSVAQLTDALIHYKELAFTENDVNKIRKYNAEIKNLENEINRLSTIGTKSFREQTGQIERMSIAINKYREFVTKATNVDQIVKYNKKIEDTTNELNKLQNAGKTGFDSLGNKLQQTTNLTQGLANGFKQVAASFGIFIGIQGLISLGQNLFKTANEVAGVDRAFTNLNRPDLLPKLRTETRGFINDFELERLTVRANNFNIPLDKMGTLLLFATQRAKETGESVDKLTEDIISGLGRKSVRIIDNLGISAVEVQKEFKKVGDFTTAVTNIIDREMGRAGTAVDTLADKTQRTGTAFSNFFKNLSSNFVRGFNPDIADNNVIAKNITDITTKIGDISRLDEKQRKKAIAEQTTDIAKLSKQYDALQDKLKSGEYFSVGQLKQNIKATGEQLAAKQAVVQSLNRQNRLLAEQARIQKGLTSDLEKAAQVEELRGRVSNFVVGVTGTQAQKTALIKQANDLQAIIDQSNAKAEAKQIKAEESAAQKRLRRKKQVDSEELKLNNQLTQAIAEASDDKLKIEIQKEDARFKVAKDTLEKQKVDFPELQKLIDKAIEAEKVAHAARLSLIDKKQVDERAKILEDGQKGIASVLKKDEDEQVSNLNERYKKIREDAKKAGLLTADLEKKLLQQQEKDSSDFRLKLQNENYKKAEEIAISNITTRQKKAGETDKEFELQNQKAILGIKIQFAEAALKLIQSNPEKSLEVAQIRANIATLKKELKGVSTDLEKEGGFSFDKLAQKAFGLSDDGLSDLKKGAQGIIDLFNNVSDSILASYQKEIDAGQERIDALKDQLDTAQSYFDDQNKLKNEGYANDADAAAKNVDAIKATLAQEEQARQENIKQQQEAQKVVAAIRAAEIAANTIEQVSNLATAASKIFKAHAGIPFVGVLIALGAVAALVAGFVAIRSSIKAASTEVKKKGGKVLGRYHDEGGNKYQSIDNNDPHIVEIERDEFVINKTSTAKHEKLINAINKDDFSGLRLSDYPLGDLLKGTGVTQNSEVARLIALNTIANQEKSKPAPIIVAMANQDPYTHSMAKNLAKLVKFEEEKEIITDKGDHIEKRKGNTITREWKKN